MVSLQTIMVPWIKEKWPDVTVEEDSGRFCLIYQGWVVMVINEYGLNWRHLLRPIKPGQDVWGWTDLSPADPEYFTKFTETMDKAFEYTKIEAKIGGSAAAFI